jgi:hypothetical protein
MMPIKLKTMDRDTNTMIQRLIRVNDVCSVLAYDITVEVVVKYIFHVQK